MYFLEIEQLTEELDKLQTSDKKIINKETVNQPSKITNAEAADPAKKLKNLKKRLREVEALEEKLKNGEISKPEPEQLAKVKRKNDLLMQIRQLEKELS